MIKVELGCGKSKTDGYIGIDRFNLPGVDIVADLDMGIPLESDSVDIIFCCHSLEHFDDLNFIMSEIYRISKDKAIIYILAPYHMESVNLANIYHKQVFNESTFRFFSSRENNSIDVKEYFNPHASTWGLSFSDNSSQSMEFYTLAMEYFYFPGYEELNDEEKRNARKSLVNVCDQIFYALVVNKEAKNINKDELDELRKFANENEPVLLKHLRNRAVDDSLQTTIINDIKKWDKAIKEELGKEILIAKENLMGNLLNQLDEKNENLLNIIKDFEIKSESLLREIDVISKINIENQKQIIRVSEENKHLKEEIDYVKKNYKSIFYFVVKVLKKIKRYFTKG